MWNRDPYLFMTSILPVHIVPLKAKIGASLTWYALEFKLISAAERDPLSLKHPDRDYDDPEDIEEDDQDEVEVDGNA